MRLSIRHTTRYRFTEPVIHGLQRVRLTPKSTQGQEILDWTMRFDNADSELEYEDQHCNTVNLLSVSESAREVTIDCSGTVQTQDNAGIIGRHSGHLPLWSFRGQTALTRPGPTVRELTRDLRDVEKGEDESVALDRLHSLSALIRDKVAYTIGATDVRTSGEDSATRGEGVCQDHAHIFIGAARALGIPARYVSGYLMMDDRVDQDATHAWAEAHVQGLGWVGFDISNGISPDPRYVRVATGRDYRDAAPITGISFGSNTEELSVDVSVEQQQVGQQQQ